MAEPGPVAWVESPLQLVGAAEWAATHARRVPIAGRLTPQMSATADELIARGAWFGRCEPYLGIPWALLSRHRHWIIGDGFSGQFRLAASVLRPRRITFVDDGANAVAFADTLRGRRTMARPGIVEGRAAAALAPFALRTVDVRARQGEVDFFTAFAFGADRVEALADRRVGVTRHGFAWTRAHARPLALPASRVVLGSARPVDGHIGMERFLTWVRAEAALGAVTYLPHRREPGAQREAVARIPGVHVIDPGMPVELALAGTREPLEVVTLPSSTTTTLPQVLAGTGSTMRVRRISDASPAAVRR